MEGILVWKCSLTTTRPMRSNSMSRASRPRPSVKGRRPVATRTTSKSSLVSSPPLDGATVSVTPESVTSLATTPVESLNFMPCFFRMRMKFFPISASIPGVMRSRYSMTVTSDPSRRQTLPISRPMTPPPTTASFFGMVSSSRAPVESTIFFAALSTGQGLRGAGTDPVATRTFLVESVSSPPSFSLTATDVGPVIFPNPWR
mmetsp:Transcript_5660/g.14586  ORF Transcript_5660/g.14586 Transcript_5660/m.14586 type:complete len:202 (-) Transcript_5660:329-934(-)